MPGIFLRAFAVVFFGSLACSCHAGEDVPVNVESEIASHLEAFEKSKEIGDLEAAEQCITALFSSGFVKPKNEAGIVYLQTLKWCVYALNSISSVYDREFNPNAAVPISIAPLGGNYRSGTSPKTIKEPDIRAEYEKRLAENAKRAEKYIYQSKLRKTLKKIKETMLEASVYYIASQEKEDNPPMGAFILIRE